ncbi:hypothetical protein LXL04_020153 [Taraxacum kok-saghyz]
MDIKTEMLQKQPPTATVNVVAGGGGLMQNSLVVGYPRDAPATVLFGDWFRFEKPSDQKFLFEKTLFASHVHKLNDVFLVLHIHFLGKLEAQTNEEKNINQVSEV